MKFHRLILSCIMVLSFASSVFSADKSELKKCMGALNIIIDETKKSPTLKPDLAEGMSGFILKQQDLEKKELDDLRSYKGNVNEIHACIGKGVESSQIDMLLKAYYGILSDDPYDDIVSCYAGFLSVSQTLEKEFDEKKARSLGLFIGKKIATISQTVQSLYNIKDFSLEGIESKSVEKLKYLSSEDIDVETRQATLKKYYDICDWYNIPLVTIYIGAAAGTGK